MFDVKYQIALQAMLVSDLIMQGRGNLMVFIELWPLPGVSSLVMTGMAHQTRACSETSRLLSSCEGHLRILLEAWQGNRDASRGETGDPGSLSSCHRDIGIPISFQEESGIVSF